MQPHPTPQVNGRFLYATSFQVPRIHLLITLNLRPEVEQKEDDTTIDTTPKDVIVPHFDPATQVGAHKTM